MLFIALQLLDRTVLQFLHRIFMQRCAKSTFLSGDAIQDSLLRKWYACDNLCCYFHVLVFDECQRGVLTIDFAAGPIS